MGVGECFPSERSLRAERGDFCRRPEPVSPQRKRQLLVRATLGADTHTPLRGGSAVISHEPSFCRFNVACR